MKMFVIIFTRQPQALHITLPYIIDENEMVSFDSNFS